MTSRTTESTRKLLSARAVRDCAEHLLALSLGGQLDEWTVNLDGMGRTADFVATVVHERYPQLDVPVHSRWRHFVFRGRDQWQQIAARSTWRSPDDAARAAFDLAITSVLLDAGAGGQWRYHDQISGATAGRSEGLALASLRWFESGGMSDDPRDSLRADATSLRRIDAAAISRAFQVDEKNALLGLDGRAALLNRLGSVAKSRPDLFALSDAPRPGGLFDVLRARTDNGRLPAREILHVLLEALGPIWQDRPRLDGIPLGDCWPHPALSASAPEEQYVPLHKLSQWLSYSLIEPLQIAGIHVIDVHELTGLAEYRNGGLFVDSGILLPRRPADMSKSYAVADPFVVGWRSLTVALLDRLAPLVGARLGLPPESFPLASLLEGGSWAAGRLIARKTRVDGGPPFHVVSDGTVF